MVLNIFRRVQTLGERLKSTMAQAIKVQVKQGIVVGQQKQLPNGGTYNSFKGIPYAQPPLGELRFKSPVALDRFPEAELDCSRHGDESLQQYPMTQELVGSENCLFLNVYAPEPTRATRTNFLPVMVWIHGGAFLFGSGNSDLYLPLTLIEENVIVVTLNYRLSAFGFLCLPEEGVWGNAGLKDQRLALQWVQDNIQSFNGDPHNVTLFGESAGAACVHLHVQADHANVLFHKAVMQSGTANMEWVFQRDPAYKTRKLAELLGCRSVDVIPFLQSSEVSSLAVLANTMPVLTAYERRCGLPLPFKPVIEDEASPDSFITRPILELLKRNDVVKMPIIMGYNSAEGIVMLENALNKLEVANVDFARFVPRNIPLSPTDPGIQEIAQRMRQFYFNGQALSPQLLNELVDLLSDYHFMIDMQHAAEFHVRHQPRSPLYFYRFDYVGNRNVYKRMFQMEHLPGASHGDEMCYLFHMGDDDTPPDVKDASVMKQLSGFWANFAYSGNPNAETTSLWESVARRRDSFQLDYLAIAEASRMHTNPDHHRVLFWRNVYKPYNPIDYCRLSSKL